MPTPRFTTAAAKVAPQSTPGTDGWSVNSHIIRQGIVLRQGGSTTSWIISMGGQEIGATQTTDEPLTVGRLVFLQQFQMGWRITGAF